METKELQHLFQARYTFNGREWPEVDCWGFIEEIFRLKGVAFGFTPKERERMNYGKDFSAALPCLQEVPAPQAGGLFGIFKNKNFRHAGYCINSESLIHLAHSGPKLTNPQKLSRLFELRYFIIKDAYLLEP